MDKLASVPVDVSKLSNVVKNEVVRKIEYNAEIKNIEHKIPDITNLATKTILNTKIYEVRTEIPSSSSLGTTSTLTAVENEIANVCNLVKKTDNDTKFNDIEKKITDYNHGKYITTLQFNKLRAENFVARLALKNLATITDFDNRPSHLNTKITSNKTKHLIVEKQLKKLETFDSIYFWSESHFIDDGKQNWLVFQSIQRYFKTVSANDSNIFSWKSKRSCDESIKPPTTFNKMFNPSIDFVGTKVRAKFNEDCLKQKKITFNHGKIVNIYVVYEIEGSFNISCYPILEICLFNAVKLTKHVDVDLYKYSGYYIGFNRKRSYLIGNEVGTNVIICGVGMSLLPHIDNKKKYILIFGKGRTQRLKHTLTVEKLYSINFTKKAQNFA